MEETLEDRLHTAIENLVENRQDEAYALYGDDEDSPMPAEQTLRDGAIEDLLYAAHEEGGPGLADLGLYDVEDDEVDAVIELLEDLA